jgi:hypothetical protein
MQVKKQFKLLKQSAFFTNEWKERTCMIEEGKFVEIAEDRQVLVDLKMNTCALEGIFNTNVAGEVMSTFVLRWFDSVLQDFRMAHFGTSEIADIQQCMQMIGCSIKAGNSRHAMKISRLTDNLVFEKNNSRYFVTRLGTCVRVKYAGTPLRGFKKPPSDNRVVHKILGIHAIVTLFPPLQVVAPGRWCSEISPAVALEKEKGVVRLQAKRAEWQVHGGAVLVNEFEFDILNQTRLGKFVLGWAEWLGETWFSQLWNEE